MRKLCLGLSIATMVLLAACGGDSSSTKSNEFAEETDIMAESFDDLPVCTEKRDGVMAYVKKEKIAYTCISGDWTPDSGDNGSSSSFIPGNNPESSGEKSFVNEPMTDPRDGLTDPRDGQTYKTVKIGNQVWMAENLNYRYLGPTADEDSSSFCYDDDPANCETYGRLYLWSAAMDSAGIIEGNTANGCGYNSECSPSGNVRGVCPQGWHLPSNWDEFETLFEAVGGQEVAGAMLKSTSGWNSNGDGTDAYGFSAFPAGARNIDSGFRNLGNNVTFWSSTEIGSNVYSMYLNYSYERAFLEDDGKDFGFSVRCLKD